MRPSLRLLNLEAPSLQGSRALYVCSVCRQEARPRPFVARQFLRNASSSSSSSSNAATPITERVRRKIWGTDNPPGLKDPYGGEGVFERKFKKGQAAARQGEQEGDAAAADADAGAVEATQSEAEAVDGSYEPATTWAELQRVGHLGRWSDLPAVEADEYNSFSMNRRFTKPAHLSLAAHQAAVELCLLHALNKPLTSICDVVEHEKPVFKLLWNCKIQPNSKGEWDSALVYPDKETEEALAYIFEQIGTPQEAVAPEVEAAAEQTEEMDVEEIEAEAEAEESHPQQKTSPFFGYADVKEKGYLALSLEDPVTKFAFLKRFSQLSGHFFPDPVIPTITSVKQVLDQVKLSLSPKPKKIAEVLAADETLQSLPNVKIFVKRQKPSNKDEELGRKKLIDAELRERGLIL